MKNVPVRYRLVLFTFSMTILLYIDRVAISGAKDAIASDLELSDTQIGWIMSVFALGYALFQVPTGLLADQYGPRKVIASIVSIWSFFTFLTGIAWNFVSMLVVRFLFGAGEAGAFPGISRANFTWFPLRERGLVTGINFSGSRLGAAFAFPLIVWLINSFGWRFSFFAMGLVGLIWALLWFQWFTDRPENHPAMTDHEKKIVLEGRQEAGPKASLSVKNLFSSVNMWLAMGQYFGSNFIFFFCLTWMFPFLTQQYGISAEKASFYAMFPLLAGACGNWFSGWLVDRIFKMGQWRLSRSIPAICGFLLVGIGVSIILMTDEVMIAVIALSIAVFGADMTLSPSWSFCIDIGKTYAGAVSGTMNMAGNIGSFVTGITFPYLILWTGTSNTFFMIALVLVALSIFAWLLMNPQKAIS